MRRPAHRHWIAAVAVVGMLEGTLAAVLCCRLLEPVRDRHPGHTHGVVAGNDGHAGPDDARRSLVVTRAEAQCPPVDMAPALAPADPDAPSVPPAAVIASATAGSRLESVVSTYGSVSRSGVPPATGPPVLLRTSTLLI